MVSSEIVRNLVVAMGVAVAVMSSMADSIMRPQDSSRPDAMVKFKAPIRSASGVLLATLAL